MKLSIELEQKEDPFGHGVLMSISRNVFHIDGRVQGSI